MSEQPEFSGPSDAELRVMAVLGAVVVMADMAEGDARIEGAKLVREMLLGDRNLETLLSDLAEEVLAGIQVAHTLLVAASDLVDMPPADLWREYVRKRLA